MRNRILIAYCWLLRTTTLTFVVISQEEVGLLCVYEQWSMYIS